MTDTHARTEAVPEQSTETLLALESMWRVVLLNDPVNLMSYVVLVLRRLFGFDESKAHKLMLDVHEKGRAVVWIGPREKAEAYVYSLQEWHLSAILEKDEAN